ncbi:hypothetical protein HK105_208297 [Polyrhizophydium stewartii]|uniref:LYC1 C-terminal domain-containing protein n=1 Tax=Polyrhizophydium stewartii TaxID=2732419 RepID=A0ABR4MYC9_9FUNG|nr:hypothetical protein HK105_003195 [Polyrhizophydium stewartii]
MTALIRTSAEQAERIIADNHAEWGLPTLSLEQYRAREHRLAQCTFARSGYERWALVPADDKSAPDVLSSCEVYEHPAVLVDAGGAVHDGVCLAIASVYTPAAQRRKGHAAMMLATLAETVFRKHPRAVASTLFSDIGPRYYDRLGWRVHPSVSAVLDLARLPSGVGAAAAAAASAGAVELSIRNPLVLAELLRLDAERTRSDTISSFSGTPLVAVLPTAAVVEWNFERGVFYAEILGRAIPDCCGVHFAGPQGGLVLWFHNFKENELAVLRCRVLSQAAADAALAACAAEAARHGLARVQLWDPCDLILGSASFPVELVERTSSLSSLMVLAGTPSNVLPVWINNEKFGWV